MDSSRVSCQERLPRPKHSPIRIVQKIGRELCKQHKLSALKGSETHNSLVLTNCILPSHLSSSSTHFEMRTARGKTDGFIDIGRPVSSSRMTP